MRLGWVICLLTMLLHILVQCCYTIIVQHVTDASDSTKALNGARVIFPLAHCRNQNLHFVLSMAVCNGNVSAHDIHSGYIHSLQSDTRTPILHCPATIQCLFVVCIFCSC